MTFEDAAREVYYWQYSNTGCFHNKLFDLFQKADETNQLNLAKGFPMEYMAWCAWNASGDAGDDFFREFGFLK